MIENPPTVLIASDQAGEEALFNEVLLEQGYRLLHVDDAASLIDLAETQDPLCVVVSEDFGARNLGLSLCRHLRANPATREVVVILLCGRGSCFVPAPGTERMADEVLLRPIHRQELVMRILAARRLRHFQQQAARGSRLDDLTGTYSREYMIDRLDHEVRRADRYGRCLAMCMLDVDGFGKLNAMEGGVIGDVVLRETARVLTSRLRGVDMVARSGDDEFSIVLPETSLLLARPVAERLREAVARLRCALADTPDRPITVTVSMGVSGLPHPDIKNVNDLLRCTHAALSRAMEDGGNRVEVY